MGAIVSSDLDFMNKNPAQRVSYLKVKHEIDFLKKREQVGSVVAVGAVILSMLALAGVIGGGHFILGALLAIAAFAGAYSYLCRSAQGSLSEKLPMWVGGQPSQIDMQDRSNDERRSSQIARVEEVRAAHSSVYREEGASNS